MTAVHDDSDGHETPFPATFVVALSASPGSGVRVAVQLPPDKVSSMPVVKPDVSLYWPVAAQIAAAVAAAVAATGRQTRRSRPARYDKKWLTEHRLQAVLEVQKGNGFGDAALERHP